MLCCSRPDSPVTPMLIVVICCTTRLLAVLLMTLVSPPLPRLLTIEVMPLLTSAWTTGAAALTCVCTVPLGRIVTPLNAAWLCADTPRPVSEVTFTFGGEAPPTGDAPAIEVIPWPGEIVKVGTTTFCTKL